MSETQESIEAQEDARRMVAGALNVPVEQVDEELSAQITRHGFAAVQHAIMRALQMQTTVTVIAQEQEVSIPYTRLPPIPEITTPYVIPRDLGPFYANAPYSKRGKRRK